MINRPANQSSSQPSIIRPNQVLGQGNVVQPVSEQSTSPDDAVPLPEELDSLARLTDWLMGGELDPGTPPYPVSDEVRQAIEAGRGAFTKLSPEDVVESPWFETMSKVPTPSRTAAEADDPRVRFAHFRHRVLKHLRTLVSDDEGP